MESFHGKSARYNFLRKFFWALNLSKSIFGKKSGKKNPNKKGNLFGKHSQFPRATINFSTKQVLPEFWQDWAWEHLPTLHVLS